MSEVSAWLEWLAAKITGRSRSRTRSWPSTFGCDITSVKGMSTPRWRRKRIVRTGSTRAQPRSLAAVGTTEPRSGQVWGRGVSQCQARRTRRTSLTALPMAPPSFRIPPSPEYQGISSLLHVAEHDRRHPEVRDARVTADRLLGHLERVLERGRGLEPQVMDDLALPA